MNKDTYEKLKNSTPNRIRQQAEAGMTDEQIYEKRKKEEKQRPQPAHNRKSRRFLGNRGTFKHGKRRRMMTARLNDVVRQTFAGKSS